MNNTEDKWIEVPEFIKVELKRVIPVPDGFKESYESFDVRLPRSMSRHVPFGRTVLLIVDEADGF
jgi:hypothetical protein